MGEIITGSTPSTNNPDFYMGNYLFVSPADIMDKRFVKKTQITLTKAGFLQGRRLLAGTTLFVSIGSTIGKIGQLTTEAVTNQQINSIQANSKNDSNFVFSILERNTSRLKRLSATQAIPILNKSTFSKYEVYIPLLNEQEAIGKIFLILDKNILLL